MPLLRLTLLFLFLVSSFPARGGEESGEWYDLLGYANLISSLNEQEKRTLDRRRLAMTGDADALLDLALLASGFPRDEQSHHTFRRQVREFLLARRKLFAGARDAREKGHLLFQAMREEFLAGDRLLAGYDKEQSRLTTLLSTHRYNCFSAAMLYVILARNLELEVAGVMLPSHAFVELHTPEGEIVEIEPTAADGFGLRHDAAYFAHAAAQWSQERGFAPSTHQDYLKRTIHSPYDFIIQNLIAQHSADPSTPRDERIRLQEIWSLLNPFRKPAHQARLTLYQRQYEQLEQKKEFRAIAELYQKTGPYLRQVVKIFPGDEELGEQAAWAGLQYALVLARTNRGREAMEWTDFALTHATGENQRSETLRANALLLKQAHGRKLADRGKFAEALRHYDTYRALCQKQADCPDPRPWIHQKWAEKLLRDQRLEEAVEQLVLRFDLLPDAAREERERVQKQVGALYARRVRAALGEGSFSLAAALLAEERAWARGNLDKSRRMTDNPGQADRGVLSFLSDWINDEDL